MSVTIHQHLQMFGLKLNKINMSNFHPLDVENLKYLI